MPSRDIICPVCLTPATRSFEFGGKADPHGFYRCDTCGRSCAVQHRRDGQPGHRTPWRVGTRTPGIEAHLNEARRDQGQPLNGSDSRANVRRTMMTNSVSQEGGVIAAVTACPKPDRRKQPRIPPWAVAHRAYELHEQRGGEHGFDMDDWLRAERELVVVSVERGPDSAR